MIGIQGSDTFADVRLPLATEVSVNVDRLIHVALDDDSFLGKLVGALAVDSFRAQLTGWG
jgi:hypothetical protein